MPFEPIPFHSDRGNSIQWYWSDKPSYAEPVYHNGWLVGFLNRCLETKEVVGVTIHVEAIRK